MKKDLDRIIAEYLAGEGNPQEVAWLEKQMQSDPELLASVEELKLLLEVEDFASGNMPAADQEQFENQLKADPTVKAAMKIYNNTEVFLELEKRRRAMELMEGFEREEVEKPLLIQKKWFKNKLAFLTGIGILIILYFVVFPLPLPEDESKKINSPSGDSIPEKLKIEVDPENKNDQIAGPNKKINPQLIAFFEKDLQNPINIKNNTKGVSIDTLKAQWIDLFDNKQFKEIRQLLPDTIISKFDKELFWEAKFVIGLSLYYQKDFKSALREFQIINNSTHISIWQDHSIWFSAKCFAWLNQKQNALDLIERILSQKSNDHMEMASELKKILIAE